VIVPQEDAGRQRALRAGDVAAQPLLDIAQRRGRRFARVTFLSDNRADLAKVSQPTLVLQCSDDAIAPVHVGQYVAEAVPDGRLVMLEATGHCPQLSAPAATVAAMDEFLSSLAVRG
jgi:pimeloyl-ACP methyl ester carboxylesterase